MSSSIFLAQYWLYQQEKLAEKAGVFFSYVFTKVNSLLLKEII